MLEYRYLDSNLSSHPYVVSTFLAGPSPQPTEASSAHLGSWYRDGFVKSGCLDIMKAGCLWVWHHCIYKCRRCPQPAMHIIDAIRVYLLLDSNFICIFYNYFLTVPKTLGTGLSKTLYLPETSRIRWHTMKTLFILQCTKADKQLHFPFVVLHPVSPVHWLSSVVNLTQSRITWKDSRNEGWCILLTCGRVWGGLSWWP